MTPKKLRDPCTTVNMNKYKLSKNDWNLDIISKKFESKRNLRYLDEIGPQKLLFFTVPNTNQVFLRTGRENRLCWMGSKPPHLVTMSLLLERKQKNK